MEARETDKLFRNKLKNQSVVPQADSWTKLESMLDQKEVAPWFTFGRLAVIGLLLVVSLLMIQFWNHKDVKLENRITEAIVDHSESDQISNTIVPEIEDESVSVDRSSEPVQVKLKTTTPQQVPIESKAINKEREKERKERKGIKVRPRIKETPVEIQAKEVQVAQVDKKTENTEKTTPQKKKFKSIRITYKRGNMTPSRTSEEFVAVQKADSSGGNRIKDFFAHTRDIKPGDLWADMREAKDNLFQRKENSKK